MQPLIQPLLEILEEYPQLEIVSYGLAPRPWGFCYEYSDECHGEMPARELERFCDILAQIENSTLLTNQLRKILF